MAKGMKRGIVFAVALVAMGSLALLDPAGAVDPAKNSGAYTVEVPGPASNGVNVTMRADSADSLGPVKVHAKGQVLELTPWEAQELGASLESMLGSGHFPVTVNGWPNGKAKRAKRPCSAGGCPTEPPNDLDPPKPPPMKHQSPAGEINVRAIEVDMDGRIWRIDGENFGPLRSLLRSLDPPTV